MKVFKVGIYSLSYNPYVVFNWDGETFKIISHISKIDYCSYCNQISDIIDNNEVENVIKLN